MKTALSQAVEEMEEQTAIVEDLRKGEGTNREALAYKAKIRDLQVRKDAFVTLKFGLLCCERQEQILFYFKCTTVIRFVSLHDRDRILVYCEDYFKILTIHYFVNDQFLLIS